MPPSVKICGMRARDSLEAALRHGADFVGFVFHEASPRHITLEEARALRAFMKEIMPLERSVKTVAVTADASLSDLSPIMEALAPDMLQLHGAESPDHLRQVREAFGKPVIKALFVSSPEDMKRADAFAHADMRLFEPPPPQGSGRMGGHGRAGDWSLLGRLSPPEPWFLSGGLTAENLSEACRQSGADYIDASSGVESGPGVKDPQKIADFLRAAKAL